MKLYSTNNKEHFTSLKEAVLKGLPEDNGLYMPDEIPVLHQDFINNIESFSFQEIAFTVCKALFNGVISEDDLKEIIYDAINFPAPVVSLKKNIHILELFHGPSLAFKDFGVNGRS